MLQSKYFFTAAIIACLMLAGCKQPTSQTAHESVYSRIDKTNTINCGYTVWPPALMVNPNTKEISGIFYDIMTEVGQRLNLKINWAQEVGWSSLIEDLKTGRVDMICSDIWATSTRARHVEFSTPLYYSLVHIWIRAADKNKFVQLQDLNNKNYTFGHIEGGAVSRTLKSQFNQAKAYDLPELNTVGDLLAGLKTGKYDFIAIDDPAMNEYQKQYPNDFVKLAPSTPIEAYPDVLLMPPNELRLKNMIDGALLEMTYDGTIKQILKKHNALNLVKTPITPY